MNGSRHPPPTARRREVTDSIGNQGIAPAGAHPAETHEQRARRLFDEMARNIGREAVNHLKTMYPDHLTERASQSKSWETSLVNTIRNDINWRMRPLLMALIAVHHEWESDDTD
jgi:hypothetical protein